MTWLRCEVHDSSNREGCKGRGFLLLLVTLTCTCSNTPLSMARRQSVMSRAKEAFN